MREWVMSDICASITRRVGCFTQEVGGDGLGQARKRAGVVRNLGHRALNVRSRFGALYPQTPRGPPLAR